MNREIQELREVITKLVPMLTGRGLKVTQQGSRAYVRANTVTNKPEVVNIPSIPDNATPEFVEAVGGFVDHEVGHVLFTDWKHYGGDGIHVAKHSEEGRALSRIHNVFEDTMVERRIIETFPGSRRNLDKLHRHFLDKITTAALKEAKGDEKQIFGILMVPAMRAVSGQEIFQEFMDKNDYWKNPMIDMLMQAMSNESLDMIKSARTTEETLIVSQEVHDILFNGRKKPEPEPEPEDEDEDDAPAPPMPGLPSGGKGGTPEDDGEAGPSTNPKAKKSAEPSSDDDAGDPTADEAEGEDGDPETGEVEGEDGDPADPSDEEGEDGDSSEPADGDEEGDEKSEDPGAGKGDAEDEAEEDPDFDITDGEPEEEKEREDLESGEWTDSDEAKGGGPDYGGGGGKSMFDMDPSEFEPLDVSGAMAKEIGEMAVDALKASDYSVFTRDEDKIEVFKPDHRRIGETWISDLDQEVGVMVGPMQKDIERMMAAQALSVRTPGHRSGRLHSASLYRVLQNDPRVFTRKEENRTKDTAVMLLVDNSGSMHSNDRIGIAMKAAYALGQTLERVGIPNEILGFTTGELSRAGYEALAEESKKGITFCRDFETMVLPIYKQFSERMSPAVKERIAFQIHYKMGLNGNVDGECLEYAAQRLLPRREVRKVMLVLSDGQPVGRKAGPHLKSTVKTLEKMGVETIGIGIETDAVKSYYPRSLVLNKLVDLPAVVMGELRRILTK